MGISNIASNLRPGIVTSTTRPTTPYEGQIIYETDTNRVLVWDNAAWVMIADTDQPPGLQLVKTQTVGTAVSTVDVTDVFSSDYDNYRVEINNVDASTAGGNFLLIRFNTSGNNHFGSCYYDAYAGTNTGTSRTNGGNSTGI